METRMTQSPNPGDFILSWRGDALDVTLDVGLARKGRAVFRTDLGGASISRRETIAETDCGVTPMERGWSDIPLEERSSGVFGASIPLGEVGVFSGKACFFPEGSSSPEWPDGPNVRIKVESDSTRRGNSIYTVFPRQFGSFREVARRLPTIMDEMGFRIIQTLPPFPVPTTYAVMGKLGCPFAALDFFSVDPAMAEFDERTTPLDQFRELIDAVHSRDGLFFIDLPANHTGWASALQTHHPEWFRRKEDGRFASPGAWGVVWADLVELDYANPGLRSYMADVFLFWCRNGVDGFRCDAGYMIDAATWRYIVARVREEYPDTVFMLEGLGGDVAVTDRLLYGAGLDWAYSELFQTYDRGAFEWYLPGAAARSERYGALVHFAETHDNDRLAKGGEVYARLRVQLAALLSWQGSWGMANGVEWYAAEKIDVHDANDLNWGAERNMVGLIARLNNILATHPSYSGGCHLEVVTRGDGNTLAVVRGDAELLILANLDCSAPANIEWDVSKYPAGERHDLVTGRKIMAVCPVRLDPGEVLCLAAPVERGNATQNPQGRSQRNVAPAAWRFAFPDDVKRDVVVPAGETLRISAPCRFRADVVDPSDGRTLVACRAEPDAAGGFSAFAVAPDYEGDGTRCRELRLAMVAYAESGAVRTSSRLLVPPGGDAARVRLALSGEDARRDVHARTILSNGVGASAQMRVAWGEIESQYDATLAANPGADCPSDRVNIWARTRVWLQRDGYVREFDVRSVETFRADPAGRFARWDFMMPCGMGKAAAFAFEVSLADGVNAARLLVRRRSAGADEAPGRIRLVFRPDVEWRSFHGTTKAYTGPETSFPKSVRPSPRGFSFSPGDGVFVMSVDGGDYHHEPEWKYNVAHPEEAERGQEGAGDLFSPGWISADLDVGESVAIVGEAVGVGPSRRPEEPMRFHAAPDGLPAKLPVPDAMSEALDLFIVRRGGLKTVIAGYPWFLDWGRDTFIFMRGMIADRRLDDSLKILRAFAAFEERGTLPNIIYGDKAGNRDTTDAQLWFVRCVQKLEARLGADADLEDLKSVCASIVENYIVGTPNGIHVDAASGLVWSPSHFTWMDTNYPACTPRIGYPVEIQALWISALRYLGRDELAARATESVKRLFAKASGGYCDCLDAPSGECAADARRDEAVRPNQLFLLALGVLDDPSILEATQPLLVPGGIRSLAAGDPLYKGAYTGDEDTSRKPAYHNGTAWAWVFPIYAEAMAMLDPSRRSSALALLSGAVENINAGCVAHESEIADGDSPHAQKGCTAQAWSVSELLRVWRALA